MRATPERRPSDPRDRDATLLHRLAQRLEDVASELGQLIEEQHAGIGERPPITPEAVPWARAVLRDIETHRPTRRLKIERSTTVGR